MNKLYELGSGDTFRLDGVTWRICGNTGNHKVCRPTSSGDDAMMTVAFHIDTEVQVDEW